MAITTLIQAVPQAYDPHPESVHITRVDIAIYGGAFLILLSVIGWLISKLFAREKDKQNELIASISTLNADFKQVASQISMASIEFERAASAIKDWTSANFVHRPEYEASMQRIDSDILNAKKDIQVYAERFERELDLHIRYCPQKAIPPKD